MTWQELAQRILSMPENRQQEQAVFIESSDLGSEGWIIDDIDQVNCVDYILDATVGSDSGDVEKDTTYALTP